MDKPFASEIRIYFRTPIPCDVLVRVGAAIERAAAELEREEIEFLATQLAEHPGPLDAVRYRFQKYDGAAVVLERAEDGSVVVVGILAGLAYWLLDTTLSETVSQAWTKSGLHSRLVELFSRRRQLRAQKMTERLETDSSLREGQWPARLHVTIVHDQIHITVDVPRSDLPGYYYGEHSEGPRKSRGGTAAAAP